MNPTNTQRLLLVGTTRAPSAEVMRKIRSLFFDLPSEEVQLVCNPFLSAPQRQAQFEGTQRAYRQGRIQVTQQALLEDLPALADSKTPPIVMLAGGCPYTLVDAITRMKLSESLGKLSSRSLLIGACAGAIALSRGTRAAAFVDRTLNNTYSVDTQNIADKPGVGLAPFEYLSAPTNPDNPLSQVPLLALAYLKAVRAPMLLMARDGAGIYVERTSEGLCRQEFLGDVQMVLNPNL